MHNWAKEILECVKTKVKGMGLEHIEGKDLEELKSWACIAKDIAEYDYYYHITEAMEKDGEEYGETYDEEGPMRGYRRARDSRGRYMRRGYSAPYTMDDNLMGYGDWPPIMEDKMSMGRGYDSKRQSERDMDRDSKHVMYYSDGMSGNTAEASKYTSAKRGYEEAKDAKSLNKIFDVIEADIKEMKPSMTSNDTAIVRQRLTNMANMMV